jgi:uncharacterized protein YlzI (FlbEa/FlbD family)
MRNGKKIIVGSHCVNKFDNDGYYKLRTYFKDKENLKHGMVSSAILYVKHLTGIINQWEYDFMEDVRRKRSLTEYQVKKWKDILIKLLSGKKIICSDCNKTFVSCDTWKKRCWECYKKNK